MMRALCLAAAAALAVLTSGCASSDHLGLGEFAKLPPAGQARAVTSPDGLVIDPTTADIRVRDFGMGGTESITTWTDHDARDEAHIWIGVWNSGGGPEVDFYGPPAMGEALLKANPNLAF